MRSLLQMRRSTSRSSRCPRTPARKVTRSFRKRNPLHPEVRLQPPEHPLLHRLSLRTITPILRALSEPVGHNLRPLGKTWICARGSFRTTLFNGCLML